MDVVRWSAQFFVKLGASCLLLLCLVHSCTIHADIPATIMSHLSPASVPTPNRDRLGSTRSLNTAEDILVSGKNQYKVDKEHVDSEMKDHICICFGGAVVCSRGQ